MSAHPTKTREDLIDALEQLPDHMKAEIVGGAIVPMSPTGGKPCFASGLILVALHDYARRTGRGRPLPNNAAFLVDLPNRASFSPDVAFTVGQTLDQDFVRGAPLFAVEVRSKGDYGPQAERAIRDKIADYFAAGTQVVWDVDVLRERVVRVYRASEPDHPTGKETKPRRSLPCRGGGWPSARSCRTDFDGSRCTALGSGRCRFIQPEHEKN
ncbi:MAG TPA: Uma2 family endonuclease [Caldilineaceae bacterium]|nr:Uma2 family endonuclease [Caldilineaceae bacterium]